MKTLFATAASIALLSTGAFAQTAPSTTTPPAPAPMEKTVTPTAPTMTTPSASTTGGMTMTDAEARTWVDKVVYSSDGKNLGEVANFVRDSSGKITEMQADIGGFLGIGETRVRLMPGQFKLDGDRVVVSMTADQAKTLPKITKN